MAAKIVLGLQRHGSSGGLLKVGSSGNLSPLGRQKTRPLFFAEDGPAFAVGIIENEFGQELQAASQEANQFLQPWDNLQGSVSSSSESRGSCQPIRPLGRSLTAPTDPTCARALVRARSHGDMLAAVSGDEDVVQTDPACRPSPRRPDLSRQASDRRYIAPLIPSQARLSRAQTDSKISLEGEPAWWVIQPHNFYKVRWDVLIAVMIMYSVLVVPWRIGFLQEAQGAIFVVETSCDCCFGIDIVLTFFTGFYDDRESFVCSLTDISWRYLKSFLVIDVVSVVPFDHIVSATSSDGGSGGSAKITKLLRMMRLLKLGRLFRLKKLTKLLEDKFELNMHWVNMMKVLSQVVFLIHMLSCLCYYLATPACPDDRPEPCDDMDAEDRPYSTWVRMFHVDRMNVMSRYLASFHMVTATVMAVGYGDIYPTNVKERIFSICTQLMGAIIFGFILSAVTTLIESASPRAIEAKNSMNQLKEWLSNRDLPSSLRHKVFNHHTYLMTQKSIFKDEAEILALAPTSLRIKLVEQIKFDFIKRLVRIFPNEDVCLITEVAMLLRPFQCSHHECIVEAGEPPLDLFFVKTGHIEAVLDEDYPEDVESIMAENMHAAGSSAPSTWAGKDDLRSAGRRDESPEPPMPRGRPAAPRDLPPVGVAAPDRQQSLSLGSADSSLRVPNAAQSVATSAGRLRPASPPEPLHLPPNAAPDDEGPPSRRSSSDASRRRRASAVVDLGHPGNRHSSQSRDDQNMVLCAIYGEGEAFGEFPVSPVRFQGADGRSEVLSLCKDELECVLMQFTNARERYEEYQRQSMRALWEAVMSEEWTAAVSWSPRLRKRRLKSRVLYNGRATPVDEIPPEAFQSESDTGHSAKEPELIFPTRQKDSTGRHVIRNETETDLWARWVINPSNKYKLRWDFFLGSLIIYSVIIIPYRFGFDVTIGLPEIITDIIVDIFFLLDMMANFRCGFLDNEGVINTDIGDIRRHYLQGWFLIDFLSTFPTDWVLEALIPGGGKDSRAVKLIRFARLFRLLKLARVFKLSRLVSLANSAVEIPPLAIRMSSLCLKICFMAHLVGCFWFYITTIKFSSSECDSGKLYCQYESPSTSWYEQMGPGADTDTDLKKYIVTLYWVFTTLTTVGYGDITPQNDLERAFAVVVMIFGATVFGYIIGSIAELSSGREDALGAKLCLLRDFCDERGLCQRTQSFVQRHYNFWYQEMTPLHDEPRLLHELPPSLRKEVILYIHRHTIRSVALFRRPLPDWFVATTVRLLEPQAFAPGSDIVGPDEAGMYQDIVFVQEGVCESYRPSTLQHEGSARGSHASATAVSMAKRKKRLRTSQDGREHEETEEELLEDEIVEVIQKGMMWGFNMLLAKTIEGKSPNKLVCLRCGSEESCFVFTMRHGVLSDLYMMQKDFGCMVQEVLADTIIRQAVTNKEAFKNFRVRAQEGMYRRQGSKESAAGSRNPAGEPAGGVRAVEPTSNVVCSTDVSDSVDSDSFCLRSHPFGAPVFGEQPLSSDYPGTTGAATSSGSGGSGSAESPAGAGPGLMAAAAAMCSDDTLILDASSPLESSAVPPCPGAEEETLGTHSSPVSAMAEDAESCSPLRKRQEYASHDEPDPERQPSCSSQSPSSKLVLDDVSPRREDALPQGLPPESSQPDIVKDDTSQLLKPHLLEDTISTGTPDFNKPMQEPEHRVSEGEDVGLATCAPSPRKSQITSIPSAEVPQVASEQQKLLQ